MTQATAALELIEQRTFTARLQDREITGVEIASEWEGFRKIVQRSSGLHLIVGADGKIVAGSDALMSSLGLLADPMWVSIPATTLPGGVVVPAFKVARHLASRGAEGKLVIDPALKPLANINFHDAKTAAHEAGWEVISETQWLAIAWRLSQVAANWTGGAVGVGKMLQGIRNGGGARAGDFTPTDATEQRWLQLENGDRLCDMNGNLFSWVRDDVQGDDAGVIAKTITSESISKSVALAAGADDWRAKGLGYQPDGDSKWSGGALLRGGFFLSEDRAGLFRLDLGWPGNACDVVGVRCTKPE